MISWESRIDGPGSWSSTPGGVLAGPRPRRTAGTSILVAATSEAMSMDSPERASERNQPPEPVPQDDRVQRQIRRGGRPGHRAGLPFAGMGQACGEGSQMARPAKPKAEGVIHMDARGCGWAGNDPAVRDHDEEWGPPVRDDPRGFEFLILGGAQAGLSRDTILGKQDQSRAARRSARSDAARRRLINRAASPGSSGPRRAARGPGSRSGPRRRVPCRRASSPPGRGPGRACR